MEANKTILQMKYARIVALFAKESGLTLEDALSFFYDSDTYKLISNTFTDEFISVRIIKEGHL